MTFSCNNRLIVLDPKFNTEGDAFRRPISRRCTGPVWTTAGMIRPPKLDAVANRSKKDVVGNDARCRHALTKGADMNDQNPPQDDSQQSDIPPTEAPGPNLTDPPPPPSPDDAPPAPENEAIPKEHRTMAMLCHLLALAGFVIPFGNILGPLIIWLIKKEESAFVDDQGKEALNFQITIVIAAVVLFVVTICLGGLGVLIPMLVGAVFAIIAGIKANDGVAYRYPFALRMIK